MKDPQKQSILYLKLEPWLSQWLAHSMYVKAHSRDEFVPPYSYNVNVAVEQLELVDIGRTGRLCTFLAANLTKQPEAGGENTQGCNIAIMIPNFYGKYMPYYTYLGDKERAMLRQVVRDSMVNDMLTYIEKSKRCADYVAKRNSVKQLVEMWMERNGIDVNDTNYNAFIQIYTRSQSLERLVKSREQLKRKQRYINEQEL